MKFSFKDFQFILESLNHRIAWYETALKSTVDEDRRSVLGNDLHYLQALRESIQVHIDTRQP